MDPFMAFGLMGCFVLVCNRGNVVVTVIAWPLVFTSFSLSTFFGDLKGVSGEWHTVIYLLTAIGWLMLLLFMLRGGHTSLSNKHG